MDKSLPGTSRGDPPRKDGRGRWIIAGYGLGLMLAGIVFGLLLGVGARWKWGIAENIDTWLEAFLAPLGMTLLIMLPSALYLGIALWYRGKYIREVRYARWEFAMVWGFGAGISSVLAFRLMSLTETWGVAALAALGGWNCIIPAVAGIFLCRRMDGL